MGTVAVLIDQDFEDSEYTQPAQALKEAGHQLVHVGLQKGSVVKGKKEQTPVTIDQSVKESDAEDFDAVLIPGGYSPDLLRAHSEPVEFVSSFAKTEKPIFAICHGPQLLITANLLEGRTLTGYTSIAQDIKNTGATFLDEEVVVDQNLVTSRTPKDLPAFCKACVNQLK